MHLPSLYTYMHVYIVISTTRRQSACWVGGVCDRPATARVCRIRQYPNAPGK